MIHRLARFEIQDDKLELALKSIEKFVRAVNKNEENCIMYRSLQEVEHPLKFTHYMIFKNKQAEEYHRNTDWVKEFVSEIYQTMSVETVFTEMKVIGEIQ